MRSISITNKRFENLDKFSIPSGVSNTEGEIYKIYFNGVLKVLKKLYRDNGSYFANKLYTLEMIDTYRNLLPVELFAPDYLAVINHKTVGFTVPYYEGVNLSLVLNNKNVDLKEKLFYIKYIGKVLDHLKIIRSTTNLNSIYINDLQCGNIMVNTEKKEIVLVDLDSIKIANNKPFPAKYMTKNSISFKIPEKYIVDEDTSLIIADEESDLYCYNMIVLNYLYGGGVHLMDIYEYENYIRYLKFIGIDEGLLRCFLNIISFDENSSPINYIDSLNATQICRAKKFIYDKVK